MQLLLSVLVAEAAAFSASLETVFPTFNELLDLKDSDPELLASYIATSPLAAIAGNFTVPAANVEADGTPIVVAHGMGDSCFNPGMKSITQAAGNHMGSYSVCIPTGDTQITDTINGFLMSMDKSVEVFAKKVKADPKLANGFNAFGLSQGNNVIRGYMMKYNDPPVKSFISICGINAGVGAFPQCSPSMPVVGKVCQALTEVLGDFAYLELVQNHLFQADYFRDPKKLDGKLYLKNSELAQWNGESKVNEEWKANWAKTDKFVWVKGTQDTVVWPREGEWWGQPDPSDPFSKVLTYKETDWYKEDTFGLKTADDAGKNFFESFVGEHIRMTEQELFDWMDKYFK